VSAQPVVEVEGLVKEFHVGSQLLGGGGVVHAVDDVSFTIGPGELLGLVGESGSGKSTVGNCIMRLVEPTAGSVRLGGVDVTHLSRRAMRPLRREVHMVFQDPYSSLNPTMTVRQMLEEVLHVHGIVPKEARAARVAIGDTSLSLRDAASRAAQIAIGHAPPSLRTAPQCHQAFAGGSAMR